MTPDEARKVAEEAYIFTYPLVMYCRTMYMQAIDSTSSSFSGGFGKWMHLGTSSPKDTDIVSPNNDTPYSHAWVDLRAEPWSFTMYKLPQRWLVDNPIDRCSIGSATPGLQTADDGSVTIYFQTESPGKDKESNWLPTPGGPFWPILRTYGPGKEILDHSWKLPTIKRVT